MTVTYAGQVIGGTIAGANLHLHGIHRLFRGFDAAECVFSFVVEASTTTILAAAAEALEDLFSTKYGILNVQLAGNQSFDLDETLANAFDVTPLITKVGEADPRFDTNLSRLYEISISAGLPAKVDAAAPTDEGIREFSYDVSYTSARRGGIVIKGTATATPGPPIVLARAQIAANIPARVATIALALGWTVEIVSQRETPNEGDTEADFEHAYRQIVFDQELNVLSSTFIVDPVMAIKVGVPATSTDPLASPLRQIVCDYNAAVDFEQGRDLVDVFNNIVLPYVTAKMAAVAGGSMAMTLIEPGYNFDENTIQARFEAVSAAGGTLLSRAVEFQDDLDTGVVIRYIWPLADETADEPTPAYVYQANKKFIRRVTTTTENLGDPAPSASESSSVGVGFALGPLSLGGTFTVRRGGSGDQLNVEIPVDGAAILRTRSTKTSKRFVGFRGNQLKISTRETIEVFEIVRLITSV